VERVLGQGLDESRRRDLGPPRILLVDDDADARLLHARAPEREGYEVDEAEDGHKAIDVLKKIPHYSLIMLDLAMPGMTGDRCSSRSGAPVDTAALPVLIRTGTGSDALEAELLEAGADDYVTSPSTPPASWRACRRCCGDRSDAERGPSLPDRNGRVTGASHAAPPVVGVYREGHIRVTPRSVVVPHLHGRVSTECDAPR
jgi:CheY-like chemotaxis protein